MNFTARITNLLVIGTVYSNLSVYTVAKAFGAVNILFFTLGLFLILKRYIFKLSRHSHIVWLSTVTLVASSLISTATTHENIYWFPGIVTYSFPVISFIFYFALFHKQKTKFKYIGAILLFLAAFFNEVATLQLIVTLLLAVIVSYLFRLKFNLRLIYRDLIILSSAMLVMVLAPGTRKRSEIYSSFTEGKLYTLQDKVEFIISSTFTNFSKFVINNWSVLIAIFLIGCLVSTYLRFKPSSNILRATLTYILVSIFVGFLSLSAVFGMAGTRIITAYSFYTANLQSIFSIFLLGLVVGNLFERVGILSIQLRYLFALVSVIAGLCLYPKVSQLNNRMSYQKYENIVMINDIERQRKNGQTNIVLNESTRYLTYCVPTQNADAWCNISLAKYFNVNSIRVDRYEEVFQQSQTYELDRLE